MELFCPVCQGTLVLADSQVARCPTHGGEFKVLFRRESTPVPVAQPMPVVVPPPLPVAAAPTPEVADQTVATPEPPKILPARFVGMRCVQHPAVQATEQCQACGAYMCATCDFALASGIHLCPTCATKPQTTLSKKRRNSMIWSYVCALGGSVAFVLTMASSVRAQINHSAVDTQIIGLAFTFFVFIPGVVGLGLGFGSIDRRYRNPISLWGATIWNGLLVGIFLLLAILGTMR